MVVYNKSAQLIGIDKLIPYHANAKKHPKEQIDKLASIITEYGFQQPILVDKNMVIIAGHGRLQAAQKLCLKEVPYWVADNLSEAQVKGLRLADNRVAESEWDLELLKLEFAELNDLDFDLDLTGFSIDEIDLDGEKKEGLTDEDAVPDLKNENEFGVQRGDIWQLGENRLMCGDSTSKEDVERLMAGEKADMVFTDPPYNIGSHTKCVGKDVNKSVKNLSENDWDSDFDIKPALKNIGDYSSTSASFYIFTSQFLAPDIWQWMKERCEFYSYIVWCKPNPMPLLIKKTWNFSSTELICYGHGKKLTFNYPKDGHAYAYWEFNKTPSKDHPTSKPVELISHAVKHATNDKDMVLDLFGGSGSTLIACEKTNRKCFMSEIDPHYCSVIIKRYIDYVGGTDRVFKIGREGNKTPWSELQRDKE